MRTSRFALAFQLIGALDALRQEIDQEPQIVELRSKKLVGMSREMSRADDKTSALWSGFMRRREEIGNRADQDVYISMQVFPRGPEQLADPGATFIKWAAVEVVDFDSVPVGMTAYTLRGGTYAVFSHNGPATDLSTFMYIFNEWLPNSSEYQLDDREHFEVLPHDYNALDPNAREEIWIPVKVKE